MYGMGFIPKALGLTQGPAQRHGSLVRYAWLVTTWVRPKETWFSRTRLSLAQPQHRGGVHCVHLPPGWTAPETSQSWSFPLSPARGSDISHPHQETTWLCSAGGRPRGSGSRSGRMGLGSSITSATRKHPPREASRTQSGVGPISVSALFPTCLSKNEPQGGRSV